MKRLLLLITLALATAACDEAGETPAQGAERVELGEGFESWSSFDDEPTVKVTYGLQGGFHLDLAARFWSIDPEGVSIDFKVIDPATDEELTFPTRYILSADRTDCFDEGYCQRLGVRAVFDMTEDPEVALMGKDLKVVLTLEETFGQTFTDEHIVRVDEVGW